MSTISNSTAGIFEQLGLTKAPESASSKDLGQTDFLKLMTTQLRNQDPFAPMENTEFLSQMAQFGTVSGVEKLNTGFQSLSDALNGNRALQASMIVGSEVLVPSDINQLGDTGLIGAVDLEASAGDVTVRIEDMVGQTLATLYLGDQPAGLTEFRWNGETSNGTRAPAGTYRVVAEGGVGDRREGLETLASANVDSVSLGRGAGEFMLALAGLGDISLDQVRQIKQ